MSELEQFFNSAEECAAYEDFCATQERGLEKFEPAEPALVCRWRMSKRQVPLINRHIRALSNRVVNGAPLTTNMLSWAKQHVEWSLAAGEYSDSNGVLMLVIDVNGDALMSVGPYEPLEDSSLAALVVRAEVARIEFATTGVAPELLGAVCADGTVKFAAQEQEHLCGAATLVEQLAQTQHHVVERALAQDESLDSFVRSTGMEATCFLISDEHGVVPEICNDMDSEQTIFAQELSQSVAKLFS